MTKLDHDGTTDYSLLWSARAFIYQHFAATARAPGAEDIACHFNLTTDEVENILRALHDWHALFLEPGSARIRMANPFSAVATPYEVIVGGMTYWANCAWDTFGLAAALHASEVEIHSVCAHTAQPLRLRIVAGRVVRDGAVVHFLLPFQQWYDNLVFT